LSISFSFIFISQKKIFVNKFHKISKKIIVVNSAIPIPEKFRASMASTGDISDAFSFWAYFCFVKTAVTIQSPALIAGPVGMHGRAATRRVATSPGCMGGRPFCFANTGLSAHDLLARP
jgi:hypothetical protein